MVTLAKLKGNTNLLIAIQVSEKINSREPIKIILKRVGLINPFRFKAKIARNIQGAHCSGLLRRFSTQKLDVLGARYDLMKKSEVPLLTSRA